MGLNNNHLGIKQIYCNVNSQYRDYIDIVVKEIVKQKCVRMLKIPNDKTQ